MAVINPMLNQPIDPFFQEQLEEERRYREAQEQRRREERREDFIFQEQLRNRAAQERLEMQLESQRKASRRNTKMQRKFRQEDLKAQRRRGRRDSQAMAGELPFLNDKISSLNDQLAKLDQEILVSQPGGKVPDDALKRTMDFNRRFLREYGIEEQFRNAFRGSEMMLQNTASMQRALMQLAQTGAEDSPSALAAQNYAIKVDEEKRTIAQTDDRIRSRYSRLVTEKDSLIKRQGFILQNVGPGDLNDFYQSGIGDPQSAYSDYDQAMVPIATTQDMYDFLEQEQGGGDELSVNERAERDFAMGRGGDFSQGNLDTAFSFITESEDLLGNLDTDEDSIEAFQRALDAPASSQEDKLRQLDLLNEEIEKEIANANQAYAEDYKDQAGDMFHLGDIPGPVDDIIKIVSPAARQWAELDPSPRQLEDRRQRKIGALSHMQAFLMQKKREVMDNPSLYNRSIEGQGPSGDSLYLGGDPSAPIQIDTSGAGQPNPYADQTFRVIDDPYDALADK
tara:strand:+ start:617 stop:2143 length:1527 start_codon:yes stop_codon:yes gene_type:complete